MTVPGQGKDPVGIKDSTGNLVEPSTETTLADILAKLNAGVPIIAEDVDNLGTFHKVQGKFNSGNFELLTN